MQPLGNNQKRPSQTKVRFRTELERFELIGLLNYSQVGIGLVKVQGGGTARVRHPYTHGTPAPSNQSQAMVRWHVFQATLLVS